MAINFPSTVYLPCFDEFARPITVTPLISQPGQPAYGARGIYDTNDVDVIALDGSILTDARTELDILMMEFPIPPVQGDLIDIPIDEDIDGGTFTVADVHGHGNAGGELTLTLSRYEAGKLPGYLFSASNYAVGALDFATPVLA